MSALEVGWEVARAVYSVGLLVLGVVVVVGAPPTVRVLRDLTAALSATARGMHALTTEREAVEQLREAVRRIEVSQAADRETLGDVKRLLERLLREREGA